MNENNGNSTNTNGNQWKPMKTNEKTMGNNENVISPLFFNEKNENGQLGTNINKEITKTMEI
jgi:hypothetical protein